MNTKDRILLKMTEYEKGCPERIQHFLKVHEFARLIAEGEGMETEAREILEIAAIVHDIGIRPSLEKYGSDRGELQEKEGPAKARELFRDFPELTDAAVDRICYLIAHHHTYAGVDGLDYRILIEADFLVNAFENRLEKPAVESIRKQIFRTEIGTRLLTVMFDL